MVRKIIYVSVFVFLLISTPVIAGSTGNEELKGSESQDSTEECFEGFRRNKQRFWNLHDELRRLVHF